MAAESADEEAKVKEWESLSPEDYKKAGESFDLSNFKYQNADPDPDEDAEYGQRNEKLMRLIAKNENHLPVSRLKFDIASLTK